MIKQLSWAEPQTTLCIYVDALPMCSTQHHRSQQSAQLEVNRQDWSHQFSTRPDLKQSQPLLSLNFMTVESWCFCRTLWCHREVDLSPFVYQIEYFKYYHPRWFWLEGVTVTFDSHILSACQIGRNSLIAFQRYHNRKSRQINSPVSIPNCSATSFHSTSVSEKLWPIASLLCK